MPHRKDPLDRLLDAIFDEIFDAEWKGRHGEKLAARQLKGLSLFIGEGKVLRNAYIPKDGGGTSEIDVLFITSRGVFVIESKNYSGWIFGNEADRMWIASLENGLKNRFYNPVRQNRGHIKWLGRYLDDGTPLYSIVVFSKRCELKKITVTSGDVAVIKRDDLGRTVRRIWESAEDAGPVDVAGVYRRLEPLTHVDAKVKAQHVEEAQAAAARGNRRTAPRGKGSAAAVDAPQPAAEAAAADALRPAAEAAAVAEPIPARRRASAQKREPAAAATEAVPSHDAHDAPDDLDGLGRTAPSTGDGATLGEVAAPIPAAIPVSGAVPAADAVPASAAAAALDPAAPSSRAAAVREQGAEAAGASEEGLGAKPARSAEALLCPRCHKPLVLRTAKRGANAGKQFYGCSGYPHCRYTQALSS